MSISVNSLASSDTPSMTRGRPSARPPAVDVVIDRTQDHARRSSGLSDSLSREVYCVLGLPIDVVSMASIAQTIESAATSATPYLISTPNLNFLVASRNPEFRESLLFSNLCTADGMPIVWIARLLDLPIRQRIAGSDIFQALKSPTRSGPPLTVFFFGGAEGVAAAAANALNQESQELNGRLTCVGYLNPGFGSLDEMSSSEVIDMINASNADFLLVALGAQNGQAWLTRNHQRLQIPVRSHLGATINFQAGTLKRAPMPLRKLGLEWLWRIKEEPRLWRRYWHDGYVLLRLMLTRVLPLSVYSRWLRARKHRALQISTQASGEVVTLSLSGSASAQHIAEAIACFRKALSPMPAAVVVDLAAASYIDARFLGLILVLRSQLKGQGASLRFAGLSPRVRYLFRLHEADFLLSEPGSP